MVYIYDLDVWMASIRTSNCSYILLVPPRTLALRVHAYAFETQGRWPICMARPAAELEMPQDLDLELELQTRARLRCAWV